MKKTLLLLSAGLLATSMSYAFERSYVDYMPAPKELCPQGATKSANLPTRAENEGFIDFTYAGDPVTAYRLNNIASGFIYLAFQIPVEDQTPYIGCEISAINIVSGTSTNNTNLIKSINVFVTDDLSVVPATQKAYLSTTAFNFKTIDLDTPYQITGEKPIYVGYRFKYVADTYYLPCDQVPTSSGVLSALVGTASSTTKVPTYVNYSDQEIGSLCIGARITGDNLPTNLVSLFSLNVPSKIAPGENIGYNVTVKNAGANEVNSLDVKTSISDGNEYTSTFTLDTPLGCGEKTIINVNDIPNKTEGVFRITSSAVSVNGNPIESPSSTSGVYSSFSGGYERAVVIEEATGNWCGYCPRGIVMMEYLKEHYPNWILIGVHGGSASEPMLVPGYNEWIAKYISGFPSALANRIVDVTVAGNYGSYYKPIYDYFAANPSYAKVELTAEATEQGVEISSTANFLVNADIQHNLTYVIVEDEVGPYSQTNYYYNGNEALGGWEDIPSGTKVKFNDVARAIDSFNGLPDAFPASVTKDTDYTYSTVMPLSYDYGVQADGKPGTIIRPYNASVVAMITNAMTGEIINAAQVSIDTSGIAELASEKSQVSVEVVNNCINVNGTDNYQVYKLDGCEVSNKNLGAGIYLVKADDKTFKVMVK